MRKTFAFVIILMMAWIRISAAEPPLNLKKYLEPAYITKLDWLALQAQVGFTQKIQWDDYGLIDSVSVSAINHTGQVLMIFFLNKEPYLALPDHTAKKVFSDAVLGASNILSLTIPEVKDGANVRAEFVLVYNRRTVAEYENGKVSLKLR